MNLFFNNKKIIFGLAMFLVSTLCLSSCESLRRKFTRKKKQVKEEELYDNPVLEPMDYPEFVESMDAKYSRHFGLWKLWVDNFLKGLEDNQTDKHQKYNLVQMQAQLEELQKFVIDSKKIDFDRLIATVKEIRFAYEKPQNFRNESSLRQKVILTDKEIRINFKPSFMKDVLIKN